MKNLIKKYTVDASRNTGEWLNDPEFSGEEVEKSEWDKMSDTEDKHFDTFEKFGKDEQNNKSVTGETCAIEVTWVDE